MITVLVASAAGMAEEQAPPTWSGVGVLTASHAFAGDLRQADGTLVADELLAEGRGYWRPHAAVRIGAGFSAGLHGYDSAVLQDGYGVDRELASAWVRVPLVVMFSPHWGATVQGSVGSGSDGEAGVRAGRQHQLEAGVLYVRDRDLIVSVTAHLNSRLGRSQSVFPVVSALWRFHDDWSLTVVDEVDQVSRLDYRLRPDLDLGLRLDVQFFEYALDAAGPDSAAVLRDARASLALGVCWRPFADDTCTVRPFAGAVLARNLTLFDAAGDELLSTSVRPSPLIGLTLRSDF